MLKFEQSSLKAPKDTGVILKKILKPNVEINRLLAMMDEGRQWENNDIY